MTGFMICNSFFLNGGNDLCFSFQSPYNTIDSIKKVLFFNDCLVFPCCNKGRFVTYICNISARKARSLFCHKSYIKTFYKFNRTKMNFKYSFSFNEVRKLHMDLTIKTTGTHQRSVEDICPVCGCKDYDSHVCTETIHLSKKLVQSIFSLVVRAKVCITTSCPANSINFIYKDNTRCFFFCLFKQISDSGSAHTNKHFNKI